MPSNVAVAGGPHPDDKMSKLRRQQTPVPAGFGKSLSRSETLQRAVRDAHAELERRLEPLMEHAGSAVDELNFLFDPGAIDETLLQQHQAAPAAELPKSKSAAAALEAVQAVAEEKAEASLERVGGSLIDPKKIMLKDKLAFVFGVGNVCLTAFWVGRWPGTYYWFWLVKDIVLFTLRWFLYRQKGMHYMMLEYCYFANLLAFYHLFFAPQSALLRRFSFAVMSGPLMWSIVAMRNSLVFHDGDKITTLMMHSSPALSAWCMRWYPRAEWTAGMSAAQLAEWNSASWVDMAIVPTALNLSWLVLYYVIIFGLVDKRIQERGYQNMFTAMIQRPSARKSSLAKLVLSAPPPLQPLVYLGLHTFASWLALLPTKIWFDWYWAHTAILLGILTWSAWNGANFYLRVFAKKLMAEKAEKEGRAEPAAAAAGSAKKAE